MNVTFYSQTTNAPRLPASAAAAATATTTTTAAATTAFLSNVDANGSTIEFLTIHFAHSALSCFIAAKSHETETTAATSIAILNHFGFFYFAKAFECRTQSVIIRGPSQAAYK